MTAITFEPAVFASLTAIAVSGLSLIKSFRNGVVEKVIVDDKYRKRTEEIATKVVTDSVAQDVIRQREINKSFSGQLADIKTAVDDLRETVTHIPELMRQGFAEIAEEMRRPTTRARTRKAKG